MRFCLCVHVQNIVLFIEMTIINIQMIYIRIFSSYHLHQVDQIIYIR